MAKTTKATKDNTTKATTKKAVKEETKKAVNVSRETKGAAIANTITQDVNTIGFMTETINKKGHHIVKAKLKDKTFTFKVCPLVKENRYRVYCSAAVILTLGLKEEEYTFHEGWAVKYTLNTMTLPELAKCIKAAV